MTREKTKQLRQANQSLRNKISELNAKIQKPTALITFSSFDLQNLYFVKSLFFKLFFFFKSVIFKPFETDLPRLV